MGQFVQDYDNGRANLAFTGNRNDVWHRLGTEMQPGMSMQDWITASGNDFTAVKSPAFYQAADGSMQPAADLVFVTRQDNGALLGRSSVTDGYVAHQPHEFFEFLQQYISVDDRFRMDVAGNFKGGAIIWAGAVWREQVSIAGDRHTARLLASTSFDATQATRVQMCITRAVCDNTLGMAHTEHAGAVVSVRHSTRFNRERVGRELAGLAQSVARYKQIGDAMASVHMAKEDVSAFFKQVLDIAPAAKPDDISTRKMNQFRALTNAFAVTRRERNAENGDPIDVWTALQAVTRYIDHDRVSINGDNGEKQFLSANFGSGDALKATAMQLLMPRIKDKIAA
jgi:phage/plasmid-like protein (TIGR03299 family)